MSDQTIHNLYTLGAARFANSADMAERFFETHDERVSEACLAIARRFLRGGRLLTFGAGQGITDARHIAVEFVHPVIVGKRALPAVALEAVGSGSADVFARQITALGRPADIALAIDGGDNQAAIRAGLTAARQAGLLTIALSGVEGGALADDPLDFCFVVPAEDPAVIQEIHETLYHILWELVHVFFDHQGLIDDGEERLL